LSFGISIREGGMKKPDGYSEDRLDKIAKKAEENYESDVSAATDKPNVIFIMNESWSDLRVLGNLETSEPFMPFIDSMDENTIRGNLHVGILGGLTANSEFEVLTGDSLTFLAPGAIPYQLQINHDIYALPRVFKDNGYQTFAMHPNMYHIWNRENVYNYMGFDDFIDVDDFKTEYLYERHFLSDECNYNEIIWQYENRDKSKPWFLFNVTIQNHGDYYGGVDLPLCISEIGPNAPTGYLFDAETYLNLVKISDEAFADLVGYFSNVSEPTIICMFGDHQPSLGTDFYNQIFDGSGLTEEEKNARKYITPYIIWSNYDIEEKDYGDISANYLGAVLTEYAGLELPPYYKMLLNLKETYPVISSYTINDIQKDTLIQEYKMMQYQHLIEKNYNSKYFSAK
jgi:phosphoglycerol transferase MdoB-like AlkP superfamily enzyme